MSQHDDTSDAITRLREALKVRYRIERKLGEGGMARVYLAQDLRHERSVALKVLKPEYAEAVGADRFLAEIKTTANLQHPNILPLHDSGESEGVLYYVMPYVAGESLRDRLDREKQLPVAEAVRIATSIANALDYAHRQGVIHRDVKPANVLMLDDNPVVADFGIARGGGVLGARGATEPGVAVGTPYYMSPEQATGDGVVGPRSDLYSLACVLYEMLTGEPPYQGATIQAVLGKIIAGGPLSVSGERRTVPPNVDAAIRCALEVVPADRFSRLSEFREALANPAFRYRDTANASTEAGRWRGVAVGSIALSLVAVAGWVFEASRDEVPPAPVERYELIFQDGQTPTSRRDVGVAANQTLALSPDGSRLAYVRLEPDGTHRLWLRTRDDESAVPIEGTEGAVHPFFSPDGSRVGFVTARPETNLRWVPLEGGPPLTLVESDTHDTDGASWGEDDYVYFVDRSSNIRRVPSAGGASEIVLEPDREGGKLALGYPDAIPGGRGLLLTVMGGLGSSGMESDSVAVLDLLTGRLRTLRVGLRGMYVRSGHVLFVSLEGDVMAAPFDEDALATTGPAVPVLSDLPSPSRSLQANLALSRSGRLVYGRESDVRDELVWVDRSGRPSPVEADWVADLPRIGNVRLAPGDGRIAMSGRSPSGADQMWIKELGGTSYPLPYARGTPSWSPDGSRILFVADTSGRQSYDLWSTTPDGAGTPQLLFDQERPIAYGLWEPPEGAWLLFRTSGQPTYPDFYRVQPGGDPQPLLVADSIYYVAPALSPGGRYLAYASDEPGSAAIYVRSYPDLGRSWPIGPGVQPLWSHDGRELYFVRRSRPAGQGASAAPAELIAVTVDTSEDFRVVGQAPLFPIPNGVSLDDAFFTQYDVTEDGERFLMIRSRASEDEGPTYHVVNGFDELIRRRLER